MRGFGFLPPSMMWILLGLQALEMVASIGLPKSLKYPAEMHSIGQEEVLGLRKQALLPGNNSTYLPLSNPPLPSRQHTHPITIQA